VLVVRLGAIGDVANALVVANALRDHRPGVRIGWAVHDLAAPLVTNHPSVDRVHRWRRGGGVRGLRDLVRELRAEGYGLAIDLQRILKSAVLARASRAPRVLGFDRARSKELSWLLSTERIEPGPPYEHMVLQYMRFARSLGIDAAPRHALPTDAAAAGRVDAFVHEHGEPIVVSVGASKPENRWPPERFAELVLALSREAPHPIVLTGAPSDRDPWAETLQRVAAEPGIHDRVGDTDLVELVELERRACVFVGCDTGPMHLAAAVGTPVVALFGPADPRRTGPWGSGHRVVRASEASGRRMEGIAVDAVVAAVLEAVRARPGVRSASR